MQQFELLLKNDKVKIYYRFNQFIIIILSLLFFYFAYFTERFAFSSSRRYFISGFVILFLVAVFFDKRKNKNRIYTFALLYQAYIWIVLRLYWLAGVILLLDLLFLFAVKTKIVKIDTEKIIYPSFPKKIIQWDQLSNAILKDGILTLDFKNNRLIQQPVDESVSSVNEKEFNEFCRKRLGFED